jgi:glycine cleavage system H protein
MSEIPTDLRYSENHLWVRPDSDNNLARVGITDFAQGSLGDVVEVTLPGLGQTVTRGQACGAIESTKAVSDLISPLDGKVHIRNDVLTNTPELVNTDPYGQGWMFEVEVAPSALSGQLATLMDAHAYRSLVGD